MTNGLNNATKAYFRYTIEGPITTSDNVDVTIENFTDANNNIYITGYTLGNFDGNNNKNQFGEVWEYLFQFY